MNTPTDLGMHAWHDTKSLPGGALACAGNDPDDEGNGTVHPSSASHEKSAHHPAHETSAPSHERAAHEKTAHPSAHDTSAPSHEKAAHPSAHETSDPSHDKAAHETSAAEAQPSPPKKASRSRRGRELDTETAIGRLSDQHRELARLFKKLDREATKSGRRLVFSQVATLLATHRMLEEQHFYPELREALPDAAEIDEAQKALESIRRMAEDIRSIEVTDPRFSELVLTLRERVEQHVEDVEASLFPRAEQALGVERLRSIGGLMSESLKDLEERARRGADSSEEGEEAPPR